MAFDSRHGGRRLLVLVPNTVREEIRGEARAAGAFALPALGHMKRSIGEGFLMKRLGTSGPR